MLQKKSIKILLIFFSFILLVASIQMVSTYTFTYSILRVPEVDGVISSDEYTSSLSLGGGNYNLNWEVIDDTNISIGITVKTTGWLAIGFNPSVQMKDADIIYAWVESNGTVVIKDAYSLVATGSNHPEDTDLGGTNDILSYAGLENTTSTTIEFTRLLATGDQYDSDIPLSGEIDIIWAYGVSDSFSEYHGGTRGSSSMTISTPQESTTMTVSVTISQDELTTSTQTASTPGFQGFLLVVGILYLVIISRKQK